MRACAEERRWQEGEERSRVRLVEVAREAMRRALSFDDGVPTLNHLKLITLFVASRVHRVDAETRNELNRCLDPARVLEIACELAMADLEPNHSGREVKVGYPEEPVKFAIEASRLNGVIAESLAQAEADHNATLAPLPSPMPHHDLSELAEVDDVDLDEEAIKAVVYMADEDPNEPSSTVGFVMIQG